MISVQDRMVYDPVRGVEYRLGHDAVFEVWYQTKKGLFKTLEQIEETYDTIPAETVPVVVAVTKGNDYHEIFTYDG